MKRTVLAAASLCFTLTSHALPDLLDIYQQALANDPSFKQAYSSYMSAKEVVPQAMAALRSTISVNANWSDIHYDATSGNPLVGDQKDNYTTKDYTVSLMQPVFNIAAWAGLKQANNSAKQALATFDDAVQQLLIRTAQGYFAVLQAKDNLKFSRSQLEANGRSLEQARQRFKVGLDAITSVYEAQAAYDSSRSLLIVAKNNLHNQFENLRILTNHTYQGLAPLRRANVPLVRPEPQNIDSWTDKALQQNYLLKAAKFGMSATKNSISVNNAGHLPTLNFGATYNYQRSDSGILFLQGKSTTAAAKLSLNVPIYQGGLVVSKTRQAAYNYQASRENYEGAYRQTIVNTRVAYNNIVNGISTIEADRQAVKSAQNSLESTNAQFKVGTRTMVDVVNAQKNLFQAQTQLATDQYSYILALLQLKYQAGTLSVNDLQEINHWLATKRRYARPIPPRISRK